MKRAVLLLPLLLLAAFSAAGQDPPKPQGDEVVRITTTLIQIDVTVTDKKGNPVTDLSRDEVEIYENGEKQEITSFSFVSVKTPAAGPVSNKAGEIPLPETRRGIDPSDVRRTIALVVDDLTLSFESTHFVRRALTKFVEEQMKDGDLVAIVRTSGGIGALQQFTTSKAQLLEAIKKIRWNLTGVGNVGVFSPIIPDLASDIPDLSGSSRDPNSDPGNPSIVSSDENADTAVNRESLEELREDVFVSGTLGAVRYLARGMRDLPGRKSVMLFSDGFRLTRPNSDGFLENTRIIDQLRLLIDTCNRANVVVYTMDARGLQPAGFSAEDNLSFLSSNEIENRLRDRRNLLFDTQEGLIFLARETGGIPFVNTNDLAGGIEKMLRDQSYYLVAYEPGGEVFDPAKRKFNNLEVKVNRKDVRVRYRSGFFGVADDETPLPPRPSDDGSPELLTAISSPFTKNDVQLNLHSIFKGATRKEMAVDAFLHIGLGDLQTSETKDGKRTAAFDVLMLNFGDDGIPTGSLSKTVRIELTEKEYEALLREGFVYAVTFPVKKPGGYLLRAAVRDRQTNKVGTASQFIFVPNVKKKELALSGIAVNNVSYETWNKSVGDGGTQIAAAKEQKIGEFDQFTDSARRRFRAGSVLVFALEAYNVRASETGELRMRTRLIKDGKVVFSGSEQPVPRDGGRDQAALEGALNLATSLEPGEYALQVIVTDAPARKKPKVSTQFIQFEIIDGP